MKKRRWIPLWGIFLLSLTARAEEAALFSWAGRQGGVDEATAVPLPPGRTLRLNHHQPKDWYDHFWIDLRGGQTATFSLAVGTRGLRVQEDGTWIETDDPYAGLQVRDSQGDLVEAIEIAGERNVQKTLEVDIASPQRLYVLVGGARESMHKDQFVFRVDVKDRFDGGGDRDAGATPATSVDLEARGHYGNFLTQSDVADYFRFRVPPGRKIQLQIVPSNPRTRLLASLYDEVLFEIDRGYSPRPGGAIRLEGAAAGPVLYLRVYREPGDEPTGYAVVFPEDLPPLVKAAVEPQIDYRPRFLNSDP